MSAELGFGLTIHEMIGDEAGEFASTALRVLIEDGRGKLDVYFSSHQRALKWGRQTLAVTVVD